MIVVLFEVTVKPEGMGEYLSLAAGLKNELERAEGFIRSERFKSLAQEGKLLSVSVWESEDAVERWRNMLEHRMSQSRGREALFERYAITIASTVRSYTLTDRAGAPEDSNAFFTPQRG